MLPYRDLKLVEKSKNPNPQKKKVIDQCLQGKSRPKVRPKVRSGMVLGEVRPRVEGECCFQGEMNFGLADAS